MPEQVRHDNHIFPSFRRMPESSGIFSSITYDEHELQNGTYLVSRFEPSTTMIPYGRQSISQTDIDAVTDTLKSDWITQGPMVDRFEQAVCDITASQHAVAVNSATSALHIACLALGLGEGDSLWTSPNTFVASANCALYCGARVDFVDIDADTYNMSTAALAAKLEQAAAESRLPKVVVPVHFAGQSCDMQTIHELSQQYGFRIIEDASHAIGGKHDGAYIGACQHSDITIFSFHPVKIITTGEGGMATTNDAELADTMRRLRSHGTTRDASLFEGDSDGQWDYQQIELGYNYRITDMQCALGVSQLTRLDEFIATRHRIAERYDTLLADMAVKTPVRLGKNYSAFHLYVITLDDADDRRKVFDGLRAADIGVNVHYIPVHTQPYYRKLGFNTGDFPIAEDYYSRCISLPMYPDLSEQEQDTVVDTLRGLL